jgi:hypothetical protein
MPTLHDATFREAVKSRVKALRPDAQRKWGKMTVDQMLWHVNTSLENALGRKTFAPIKLPAPRALVRFVVISMPWRKGNPTAPELIARQSYDFEAERVKTLQLVDEFAAKPMEAPWSDSALMGPMKGKDWSRLQGKHVDFHLQQFGV